MSILKEHFSVVNSPASETISFPNNDRTASEQQSVIIFEKIEKIIIVSYLFFLSNGVFHPDLVPVPLTLVQFTAVSFSFVVLWRHLPNLIRVFLSDLPLAFIIGFAGMSILWSAAPIASFDLLIWLYFTTFLGIYISMRFPLKEQLSLLLWMGIVSSVTTILTALLLPSIGLHDDHHAGLWKGLFVHKNNLGNYLVVTALLMFFVGQEFGRWRFALAGMLIFTLFMTGSVKGILTVLGILTVGGLLSVLRRSLPVILGTLCFLLPIVAISIIGILTFYEDVLLLFGRDATLSGRTDLWEAAIYMISQEPLLGYGYRAGFHEGSRLFDFIIWQGAPYAHNNWIDMSLEIGLIATSVFTFCLARTIWRAILHYRSGTDTATLFPLLFLIIITVMIFATRPLIAMYDVVWIIFVSIVLSLATINKSIPKAYRHVLSSRKTTTD